MAMRRIGRLGKRGILLISSYLVLSLFLVYSSAMTLRTTTQRMVSDGLHDRYQAVDLAQGAMGQLKDDLYEFFREEVYQDRYAGDALSAMTWLDTLGVGTDTPFAPSCAASNTTGCVSGAVTVVGDGTSTASWRTLTLPSGTGQARVVNVVSTGGGILDPRDVTIEATSTVGGVTKRLRATYRFALASSDIFRYAYFVNNYGWLDVQWPHFLTVSGEVRSNGDFRITGSVGVKGDIFASKNDALLSDPTDPFSGPAQGLITGDAWGGQMYGGWVYKDLFERPMRQKTFGGQPTIGGGPVEYLPYGQGWDTHDTPWSGVDVPAEKNERQTTQDIPYLGDLTVYKTLAQEHNNNAGSTLTYATPGADGVYGNGDDGVATVNAVNAGSAPLVIVGTWDHPIEIDGPIVVEGDVIIKGRVSGQGTIYAGRNVHIVGEIRYNYRPAWPSIERDSTTGQIRAYGQPGAWWPDLGSVCSDGTYVPTSAGPPAGRCP